MSEVETQLAGLEQRQAALKEEQAHLAAEVERSVADANISPERARQIIAALHDIESRRAAVEDEFIRGRDRLEAIGQELAAKKTE